MIFPKISVIIPTYNSANYLAQAIDSVLAQTYHDIEIIVVDDGSTDDTPLIFSNFIGKIQILCQVNHGPAAARNAGLQAAVGDYVVFLDADDLLLPEKIELQAKYLDCNPDVNVVYSNGIRFRERSGKQEKREDFFAAGLLIASLGNPVNRLHDLAVQSPFPIHAAMSRRKALLDVGGFDDTLVALEDWDLWFRLAEKSLFTFINFPVALYRIVPGGISSIAWRQRKAFEQVQTKIEISQSFSGFSKATQSHCYLLWGVNWINLGMPNRAIRSFQLAVSTQPRNGLAWSALILTRFLGRHASIFYRLKRKLFGPRQLL